MLTGIKFEYPYLLFALLGLLPVIVWYIIRQRNTSASIQVSTLKNYKFNTISFKQVFRHFIFALQVLALGLLIVVIARPQKHNTWKDTETEGIDIVVAMDISTSMLAADFNPSRIEAAKSVAAEFINGRRDDRIGLVVFAGESFTQCPITLDHAVLINLLSQLYCGMIEDGTAIGQGLANAVTRLKDSKAESKVIILLTDGVNNKGSIPPVTAAEIARDNGIRVYTIGVGTMGMAPYPAKDRLGRIRYVNKKVEIDEKVLKEIAELTNGKYFRAVNKEKLIDIYNEINMMEKTIIDEKQVTTKKEMYFWPAALAAFLIGLVFICRNTFLQTIP